MIKLLITYFNLSNVRHSIITTLGGVGCFVFAGIQINKYGINEYAVELVLLGLFLLGIKDPWKKKQDQNKNNQLPPDGGAGGMGIASLMLAMTLALSSCVSFKKCAEKFGTGETHTITVHDTVKVEVPVPGDSLSGNVPCHELQPGDTVTHVSDSGKLEVQFWKDKYSNAISYRAKQKPDTIKIEVPVEIKADCPDTVILDPEKGAPAWHRWLEGYKNFSAWAFLFLVILFGIIQIRKR